jgi:DNA polymerase/3'-5' exonuclease PolX
MNGRIGIAAWMIAAAMVWSQGTLVQGQEPRPGFSPDQAAQRLAERLSLTEQQKSTVQSYLEDQRSQMQVLRNDTALTREQRAQRAREITQQTRDKVQSILTVEQRQRAEDLRDQARQRFQERASEQFDRTARLLDLTPEQKDQMQSYLEGQRTQLQTLRDNTALTQEQRRQQARAIGEQTRSNIRSLLNPPQQQKLDDLRASRGGGFGQGQRRGGPRGRGGFGGPRGQGTGR